MTIRATIAILSVLGIAGFTNAAVRNVPAQYSTIQSAISSSADGDEIRVAPGTYYEAISFMGKDVHVIGIAGPEATIIDATGLGASVVVCRNGENDGATLEGFTLTGGSGDSSMFGIPLGGGIFIQQADPTIRNCIIADNHADGGGGIAMYGSHSVVSDCIVEYNTAAFGTNGGGAGISINGSYPDITNCVFRYNHSDLDGGGMKNLGSGPRITNCIFFSNTAQIGAGIRNSSASPIVVNCTITNNVATYGGGMRSSSGGAPIACNSIFWQNAPDQLLDLAGAISNVSYSNIQGGFTGEGNIDANPAFANASTGDLHITAGSPCIDSGDNAAVPAEIDYDLDGNDRIYNATVDMGAYEPRSGDVNPTCGGDLDGNGSVDFDDFVALLAQWGACSGCSGDLDGNGAVNFDDFVALLAQWGPCP